MQSRYQNVSSDLNSPVNQGVTIDEFILLERARALYSRTGLVILGTAGTSVLTILIIWNGFPKQKLIAWLIVATILMGIRWFTSKKYRPDNIDSTNYKAALSLFVFWAFVAGATWGLIPILFFSVSAPVYTVFITCVYTGYIAVVASSTALYLRVFLAFSIFPTALFAARTYYEGGEIYTPMSLLIVFYFFMTVVFARSTDRSFTETKRLYYENSQLLREANTQRDRAEEAISQKNNFLASASHDLRQPLHALGLFIETLEPTKLDSYQREIVSKIGQSNKALNSLLHGLLDISRLDAGVVEYVPGHFLLDDLVSQLVDEFKPQASRKGLALNTQGPAQVVVYSDAVILERILRNVIDNAIKYTEQGSVTLNYRASQDNQIILSIDDTGLGVQSDAQEKIFTEFYQVGNPERDRKKGIGLGLAIVKRLCKLADIKMDLISEAGSGTQIKFILAEGRQELIKAKPEVLKPSLDGLKIALIEDEEDIRNASKETLENKGCLVLAAETIGEIFQMLSEHDYKPDVIIADLRLRNNETGLEAIRKIRDEYNEEIPAILVTGDTAPSRLKAASEKNVDVLHKPVEIQILENKLSQITLKISN